LTIVVKIGIAPLIDEERMAAKNGLSTFSANTNSKLKIINRVIRERFVYKDLSAA
jgi:hypothetical protein